MSDILVSWIELCFGFFNDMINSCIAIATSSPDTYNNAMYTTAIGINKAIVPIATTIMFIFFLMDFIDKTIDFGIKDYKVIAKLVLRLTLAKIILDGNVAILVAIFKVAGFLVTATIGGSLEFDAIDLTTIISAVEDLSFLEMVGAMIPVTLIGLFNLIASLIIFFVIGSIYIELNIYIALAPIPLASFSSSRHKRIGENFLKTYTAVALKSLSIVIIVMVCRNVQISVFADETNFIFLLFDMFIKICILGLMTFSSGKITNAIVGK